MPNNTYQTHPSLPPRDRAMFGTVLPFLATLVLLLATIWVGASLLGVGDAITIAATLTTIVVALLFLGIRLAVRGHAGTKDPASQHPDATRGHDENLHGPFDPMTAELLPTYGKRWSLDVFANIDAQRFAAVCETWFSWAGFDTRSEAHRTSEGVDIWLHAARLPGPVAIVRCKHGQNKPVGLQEMREFQGVVANCRPAHGTFTTTSTYTPEALQYAREHGIDAVDGKGLIRRILTRTRQSQQALLAVAFNGR